MNGLLCLGACALTTAAHAQTAVYVEGGLTNYSFTHIEIGSDVSSKGDTGGIGGGVFYNFPIQSRVTVGLDARIAHSPGYKGGTLGGVALRVGFVPAQNRLRPFFQVGGGVVHSGYNDVEEVSDGFGTGVVVYQRSVTSGAAQFTVGLDIRLTDHFDLRVPELGAEAGGGDGVHAGAAFLNVGLVYHLRPKH